MSPKMRGALCWICAAWAGWAFILPTAGAADSPWLYGIHWYGDPAGSTVETMTGGKGIWSLEIVLTNGEVWSGAEWQRDNRFLQMVARGHTIIVRIQRNWGENVPFQQNLAQYLGDVQAAAQALAGVCHVWQIGNEMNLYGEWGGSELTAATYVDMFKQIRAAIQTVSSPLGPQIVLLGPVSPGGVEAGVRHTDGNDYLSQMCAGLTPGDLDGFALHAYAAPWNDAATSCAEFLASYETQLAVIDAEGFADKVVHMTEWNRRVDPISDYSEAQSAQFLHGALTDLYAWNQTPGAHPVSSACWFIYQYDSGTWLNYSIEYLHGIGPGGQDNDLWDALHYACTLNLPTAYPGAGPARMYDAIPTGINIAPLSTGVWTDTGTSGPLAIDRVIASNSKWTSDGTTPPHWLQLDLGRVRQVTGFVVRHAGAGGEESHFNTTAFQLQTAPSSSGPWEIDALVYNGAAADSTARTYYEPRDLRHVRLYITDPGIDNWARIPEFEVYATVDPGDYDGDGDVDAADFSKFAYCLGGPGRTYLPTHTCASVDLDGDRDVDLSDFAAFQGRFTGSGAGRAGSAQHCP